MYGAQLDNDKTAPGNYNVGLEGKHQNLQVRQAFLQAKVDDVAGLKLLGGIAPYDFPLVFGDTAPLFGAVYENGIVTSQLYYVKSYEGNSNAASDDSQTTIADFTFKFGDHTIRPAFFYTMTKKNAQKYVDADATVDSDGDGILTNDKDFVNPGVNYRDSKGFIGALAVNLVFGSIGIDTSGAFVSGKDKVDNIKYSSYACDFAPYYKVNDAVKLTGFFTLVSGDDGTDKKDTSFINGTIDGTSSGINNFRLYIIEDGGTFGKFSDVTAAGKYSNTNGYMAGGLVFDASFKKLTAKASFAYAKLAKAASGQKKDIGFETDLHLEYTLTKGANLFLEGAFLKTGKAYGDTKQNAQYTSAGISATL